MQAQEIIDGWNKDEVAIIFNALAAVDDKDLDYLLSRLGDCGRDRFWKDVIGNLRLVFNTNL